MRIGHGYDVHQFIKGDFITLAGIQIPCEYALKAHSDGDVVIHAVCDALLGAAGLGDIGHFFPDTDPVNKDRPSGEFLIDIMAKLTKLHYCVGNVDVTIVAQAPKLMSHMPKMRKNLAKLLQTDENDINLKATTTEGLGYIGRKEGMAVHAVVLLKGIYT